MWKVIFSIENTAVHRPKISFYNRHLDQIILAHNKLITNIIYQQVKLISLIASSLNINNLTSGF